MKIRSDSPFFGIGEEEIKALLMESEFRTWENLAEVWENDRGREVTTPQMKRFVRRLRLERDLREMEDNEGMAGRLAGRAKDGKERDGVIEATRQKLFEEALENGDQKLLLELYRSANEERARAQHAEVEQRRAAVAEEKAKIGWRKLELDQAKSALKLLPAIREALMDGTVSDGERVARMREVLMVGGGKLLSAPIERTE
jgi:hypothetical protein